MCKCSGKCGCNITSTTKGEKGDNGLVSNFGYKVYKAILLQSGTNAPVTIDLEGFESGPIINTIGTITFAYNAVGEYSVVSDGLFIPNKTYFSIQNLSIANVNGKIVMTNGISADNLTIQTFISSSASDDILNVTSICIEVYP